MSIRETAHTLMNHPACETPGSQFRAGSGFKPRLDRLEQTCVRLGYPAVMLTKRFFSSFFSTCLRRSDCRTPWGHRRRVAPEHCSSRSIYSIRWRCEYCRALVKWLKHANETVDKEWLACQEISNHQTVILNTPPGDAQNIKYIRIGQMNTFFFSWNVFFWSLNFVIWLSLRNSQGYDVHRNEIKPRTLASYKKKTYR